MDRAVSTALFLFPETNTCYISVRYYLRPHRNNGPLAIISYFLPDGFYSHNNYYYNNPLRVVRFYIIPWAFASA